MLKQLKKRTLIKLFDVDKVVDKAVDKVNNKTLYAERPADGQPPAP